MEKILLVVFGATPVTDSLNFACYLSGMGRSRLTGYFLENNMYEDAPALKTTFGFPYVETIVAGDLPERQEKGAQTEENRKRFMKTCNDKGIFASAHHINTSHISEVIADTAFADLLIIDAGASVNDDQQEHPSSIVKQILASAQCPVIVSPTAHSPIEEVVFCYDGSPSSLFAMKQFVYLLPDLDVVKATVIQVKSNEDIPATEKKMVMNWLNRHYNFSDFIAIKGTGEDELLSYLRNKKNTFVVMGAYGRNMLSRFFRQSHADQLIQTLPNPFFITHY